MTEKDKQNKKKKRRKSGNLLACAFPVDEDELERCVCYGGLDFSSTTVIMAFVLAFPPLDEEKKYIILPYFWIPEETLAELCVLSHKFRKSVYGFTCECCGRPFMAYGNRPLSK